jgi:hypothetical protein
MYPRSSAGMFSELLATRDAARNERDDLRAQLAVRDDARDEELRLLRAEIASLQPSNAALSTRIDQLKGELDNARNALRRMRRGAGPRTWIRRGGGR